MKWSIRCREDGQVLIQVTLALFVLVLFVALAVDVGHVYAERRHMQNAADAGALAGAREICFGDPDSAEYQAWRYATEKNGAQAAHVEIISGYKVHVVASEAAETYFIRLIPGLETVDVGAEATAACGRANRGSGFFPIAFDLDTWGDIECLNNEQFLVWDDDTVTEDLCDICDCSGMEEEFGGEISANIGPGQRGWVTLSAPPDPVPIPEDCGNVNDCGANALKCWLEHDYPGNIDIGMCVPGKPGVVQDALPSAGSRVGGDKDIVRILLWDETPCTDDIKAPGCQPGGGDDRWYYIADFGCVKIEEYEAKFTLPPREGHKQNECPKNAKVIRVTKLCDCPPSSGGSTGGDPIPEGGIGAVSLIE